MKVKITFKTPYATDAVEEEIKSSCEKHWEFDSRCDDCQEVKQERKYAIQDEKEKLSKFIQFDELVTIEFDTEAGTATVLPVK